MNEEAVYSLILETLGQAASQNPEVLKSAEEKLLSWKLEPGFHTYLVNIVKNRNVDNTVRWLAILCFKNGVEKYWRKAAPNAIEEAEKRNIRQLLISDFEEPIPQIQLQIAVVISKIARFDWPNEWPELVPTLLSATLQNNDNALVTWQHVTKALSSKRLCGDIRLFQELTESLFPFMMNVYTTQLKFFLTENTDSKNLRKCLIFVKILRKLVIFGFKKPHECPLVVQLVNDVFPQVNTMLQFEHHQCIDQNLLQKYIFNLCKILLKFHEFNPLSFIPFLKPCLDFCVASVFPLNDGNTALSTVFKSNEKCLILILNLLKNIILCAEYNNPLKKYDSRPEECLHASAILKEFFTPNLLEHISMTLVTQYLLLTQQELLTWDEDPEAALCDEGGQSWRYSFRPCVETLFFTIFHDHKNILTEPLIRLFHENRNPVDPNDMNRILLKDAIYNAIGLAAFDLYDEVDLDDWFQTTLRQEMQMKHNNYRIIRKRIGWLLGNWCNVKFSSSLRPLLYESLLPLMSSDEDLAVRMAACQAFKMCVDDFEFNTEQFLPFVGIYFQTLYKLLCDAKECDTKMHVLSVCSFLIERMGSSIADFADDIFGSLPVLWAQSEDHNLLRCAIVTTLTQLTISASKIHSIVPQVIRYCADTQGEQFIYMIEDGLALWLAVLRQSSNLTLEMNELYPFILDVLKESCDHYVTCSKIMRAYILLDPVSFYSEKLNPTISIIRDLAPQLRLDGFTSLLQIIELCIRVVPAPPLASLHPVLSMHIEFLVKDDGQYGFQISLVLSILSRIILLDESYFLGLVQEAAQRNNTSPEEMLSIVVDAILDKVHLVTQPVRRKLIGLALSCLLTCKSLVILNKFKQMAEQLVEIFHDIMWLSDTNQNQYEDSLTNLTDVFEVTEPTEHEERKKRIAQFDPVYQTHIHHFVQAKLSELCSQIGAESFASMVSTADEHIVKNLQDFISI